MEERERERERKGKLEKKSERMRYIDRKRERNGGRERKVHSLQPKSLARTF